MRKPIPATYPCRQAKI